MATSNPGMVMNELLCFCFNMLDCMAQSLLQKICVEFYNDAARDEVMKHNEDESLRNKLLRKRKGTAKKSSSMKDILDTVRSNDSSVFPVYVARSLGNIQPVTKNCVNMTSMMVELGQLRAEVKTVNHQGRKLDELVSTVRDLKAQLSLLMPATPNECRPSQRLLERPAPRSPAELPTPDQYTEPESPTSLHGQNTTQPQHCQESVTSPANQRTHSSPSTEVICHAQKGHSTIVRGSSAVNALPGNSGRSGTVPGNNGNSDRPQTHRSIRDVPRVTRLLNGVVVNSSKGTNEGKHTDGKMDYAGALNHGITDDSSRQRPTITKSDGCDNRTKRTSCAQQQASVDGCQC